MVKITCINKSGGNHQNPHEAVSHYGWVNPNNSQDAGKTDRQSMVDWVKKGNTIYVEDATGNRAYCYVNKSAQGTEFLQTQADETWTNNLLSLRECK